MVFEVRAEDKELTSFQRKFSMKEILTRLDAGGESETELFYYNLDCVPMVWVELHCS